MREEVAAGQGENRARPGVALLFAVLSEVEVDAVDIAALDVSWVGSDKAVQQGRIPPRCVGSDFAKSRWVANSLVIIRNQIRL